MRTKVSRISERCPWARKHFKLARSRDQRDSGECLVRVRQNAVGPNVPALRRTRLPEVLALTEKWEYPFTTMHEFKLASVRRTDYPSPGRQAWDRDASETIRSEGPV